MKKKRKDIDFLKKIEVREVKKIPKAFNFKTHKVKAKNFFIPHAGNNHHPHLLHTKRALFYSLFFVALKAIVFVFTVSIPLQAFMMPDVLAKQRSELLALVKQARTEQGLDDLSGNSKLYASSQAKSDDMLANSYFSHNSPDGKDLKYFLSRAGYGYKYAGENLAMGFSDAKSVVNAWIKSPLHYRNIIDPEFSETGMGITSGEYEGKETVFITQHFGLPSSAIAQVIEKVALMPVAKNQIEEKEAEDVVVEENASVKDEVLGEKVLPKSEPEKQNAVNYLSENSRVFWKYDGKNTTLTAKAYIEGDFKEAIVYAGNYTISLQKSEEEENLYSGSLTVAENIDTFFKPVITPSILIQSGGKTLTKEIEWYKVKTVEQTSVEKYQVAKNFLPVANSLFVFSNSIYLIAALFLIAVLLLTIAIEIKKQHPHIIIQTLALLILLSTLVVV